MADLRPVPPTTAVPRPRRVRKQPGRQRQPAENTPEPEEPEGRDPGEAGHRRGNRIDEYA